jgi:hypothetical protein
MKIPIAFGLGILVASLGASDLGVWALAIAGVIGVVGPKLIQFYAGLRAAKYEADVHDSELSVGQLADAKLLIKQLQSQVDQWQKQSNQWEALYRASTAGTSSPRPQSQSGAGEHA